ncbi:MAG: response regulator transcription factor [Bacilli bacterium]|nr:response regulator transcription factor [Bacilli bacterium]
MSKIIIVEDDYAISTTLKYDLNVIGYEVEVCDDGKKALELLTHNYYDLAIIDLILPSLNGIELIERVRMFNTDIKIIILSAKDEEMDVIKGLDIGANDYVTKPFSTRQFMARVRNLLRNSELLNNNSMILINSKVKLDYKKREVYLNDVPTLVTKLEYELLLLFVNNKNTVLSRNEIMNSIWGYDYDGSNRVVDIYIHKLKDKLGLENELIAKRGVGYILYA